MSNHFHFIVLTLDTNYLDAIWKVCYTTSLLVLKYFLLLTSIYDFFVNYKVQWLYLFHDITTVVFVSQQWIFTVSIIVLHT